MCARTTRFAGANATAGETRTVIRSPAPTRMVDAARRTPNRTPRAVIPSPSQLHVALTLPENPDVRPVFAAVRGPRPSFVQAPSHQRASRKKRGSLRYSVGAEDSQ